MRRPSRERRGEAGFSLLEVLIATAIFVLAAGTMLQGIAAGKRVLESAASVSGPLSSAPVDRFGAVLRDASQSAIAVAAPSGLSAGPFGDVKLVMFVRDDAGNGTYTGYAQNGANVYRLDYGSTVPGSTPSSAGLVDGITKIDATTITADQLAATYGSASVGVSHSVPLAAGAVAANLPVAGGNHVVAVTLANAAVTRTIHLAAGVMPSGFTIRGTPVVHAVVYRVDNPPECVRVLGVCVGTRTTGNIYGRVSVSYDNGTTWHVWCDAMMLHANVYVGPTGFFTRQAGDGGYDLNDPTEKTGALVDRCRSQLAQFPDVNATDPPHATATSPPIVYETAPPSGTITYCTPGSVTSTCVDPTPQPRPAG